MGPILTAEIEKDLNTLFWLCNSGLKGGEVIDLVAEVMVNTIAMCFRITDLEKLKRRARTEAISLLYNLAIGKVNYISDESFGRYLFTRY